jgi:predicted RNA binding protein YcfA (HicA-like mRNA interferase family)
VSLPVSHHLSQHAPAAKAFIARQQELPDLKSKITDAALALLSQRSQPHPAEDLEDASSSALDPQVFFAKFKGYDSSLFKQKHIEHLHDLMRTNVFGGYVHFFDLIALDCLDILEQSRLFLSQESYEHLEEAWIRIYMHWVLGSYRMHLKRADVASITEHSFSVFVLGQLLFDTIDMFSSTLYLDLDRQSEEKRLKTKSKVIAQKLLAESVKIPLLKQRWQKNIDLMRTIMTCSDRGALFIKMMVVHFPHISERKNSSFDEAKECLKMQHKLGNIFLKGMRITPFTQMNLTFLEQVQEAMQSVIEAKPKSLPKALQHLQQKLKDTEELLEHGGEKMSRQMLIIQDALKTFKDPTQTAQIHKNYEIQIFQLLANYHCELILNKIAVQVDVLVLPMINKEHVPRMAWIDRAFTGIRAIIEKDIPVALIQAAAEISKDSCPWKIQLSKLRLEYALKVFSYHEILGCLDDSRYEYGYLSFFDKGVSIFLLELKHMVSHNLEHLEKILEEFVPPFDEVLQETVWLTKLLVLEHDLHVLLKEYEPKDEEEILASYLHLLDKIYYQAATKQARELEKELERYQLQKQAEDELAELVAHIDRMDIHLGQVHSKLPQQPLETVEKKASSHQAILNAEPARPSELLVPIGKFTGLEAENFKRWKNASVAMVEKKLREIGLVFLRQKGSHRQYGLKDDKSVRTTLAFHPGRAVPLSVLNKIVKQVGITDPS